ncbi:MAG: formylglycine-generating enzyme family protein [Anaerolineales bacterium]|nr:MAG: formylglycine-generating enzyme family protein [Anaerolineales bacterium]
MIETAIQQATAMPVTEALEAGETMIRTMDGMTLVYVPAGLFMMGSEDSGDRDEMPVHQVTLDAFWMDQTEVTQSQYRMCVAAGQCAASALFENTDWDAPAPQQPVVGVTWFDAADYCQWAGGRLPTEAEWEYAARGPEGYTYPWGNDLHTGVVNCYESVCQYEYDAATPVGSFPEGASWVGALDMAGNVWEWVADWAYPYPSTPVTNPTGPDTGQYRVKRGGDFYNSEDYMRSTYREGVEPAEYSYVLGFRCASAQSP